MNASRARRRWMAWGRYVAHTRTQTNRSHGCCTDMHAGQHQAYQDYMFAGRACSRRFRIVYYPAWMMPVTSHARGVLHG